MTTEILKLNGEPFIDKQPKVLPDGTVTIEDSGPLTIGEIISRCSTLGLEDKKKGLEIFKACIKAFDEGIDELESTEKALIREVVEANFNPLIQGRIRERFELNTDKKDATIQDKDTDG